MSNEEAERLKVEFVESLTDYPVFRNNTCGFYLKNIELDFKLTYAIREEIKEWKKIIETVSQSGLVDLVIVPLPMLQAMKNEREPLSCFRCIRMVSRLDKRVCIDRFCI